MSRPTRRPISVILLAAMMLSSVLSCSSDDKGATDKPSSTTVRSTTSLAPIAASTAAEKIDALKVPDKFCDAIVELGMVAGRVRYDPTKGADDPEHQVVTAAIGRFVQRMTPIVPDELKSVWGEFDVGGTEPPTAQQSAVSDKVKDWIGVHCAQDGK